VNYQYSENLKGLIEGVGFDTSITRALESIKLIKRRVQVGRVPRDQVDFGKVGSTTASAVQSPDRLYLVGRRKERQKGSGWNRSGEKSKLRMKGKVKE
jgi:hypothetical protein